MVKVDLNSDLGESFGAYTIGLDEQVLQHITSANIACGWHAGDPMVLKKTIACAKENGVAIGAHPGFPDLLGFGRRNMAVSPDELYAYTLYQLGAFAAFARAQGLPIQHLKAHGALYNMAGQDIRLALAIARAVRDFDAQIILMCLAGSKMIEAATEMGLKYASEVFADRAYEEDGSLVARSKEGAMIHDEDIAIERVVKMVAEGRVTAINGKEVSVRADSICVHGDNIHAVAFVGKIHAALSAAGITVAALNN